MIVILVIRNLAGQMDFFGRLDDDKRAPPSAKLLRTNINKYNNNNNT